MTSLVMNLRCKAYEFIIKETVPSDRNLGIRFPESRYRLKRNSGTVAPERRFRIARNTQPDNLGSTTLGIYLVHVVFVQAFSDRFMMATNYAHPLASVLIAILIFACGYVVTSIVKKIPFVGKWIV